MSNKKKMTKAEALKALGQEEATALVMQAVTVGTPEQKESQVIILKHCAVELIANHIFNQVMNDSEGKFNNVFVMTHLDAVKEEILEAVDEMAKAFQSGKVAHTQF